MIVFSGTTTGEVTEVANGIPFGVMSFSIVMNSAGSLEIAIGNDDGYVKIWAATTLNTLDKVYNDDPIRVQSDKKIKITTSSSCDYYFSIT
jgi:hypothetical protein